MEKLVFVEKQSVRLMLWDCAGQEEFDSITRDYYKGKFCFLVLMRERQMRKL